MGEGNTVAPAGPTVVEIWASVGPGSKTRLLALPTGRWSVLLGPRPLPPPRQMPPLRAMRKQPPLIVTPWRSRKGRLLTGSRRLSPARVLTGGLRDASLTLHCKLVCWRG